MFIDKTKDQLYAGKPGGHLENASAWTNTLALTRPISDRIQEIASEASIATVVGTKPGKGFDAKSAAKSWFSETHR